MGNQFGRDGAVITRLSLSKLIPFRSETLAAGKDETAPLTQLPPPKNPCLISKCGVTEYLRLGPAASAFQGMVVVTKLVAQRSCYSHHCTGRSVNSKTNPNRTDSISTFQTSSKTPRYYLRSFFCPVPFSLDPFNQAQDHDADGAVPPALSTRVHPGVRSPELHPESGPTTPVPMKQLKMWCWRPRACSHPFEVW